MCVNCHSEMTHRDCVLRPVHVILNLVMSWFLKFFPCGALWMILDGWHHRTPPQFHIFTHPVTESTHVSYPACCIKPTMTKYALGLWLWLDPRDLWTVHSNPSVPGTLSKSSPLDKISRNLFRVGSWWIGSSEMSRSSRIRNFIVCTIVRETFRSIELPFRVAKWSFLKEKSFKKDVWKCDLDVTYYFFVRCHLN